MLISSIGIWGLDQVYNFICACGLQIIVDYFESIPDVKIPVTYTLHLILNACLEMYVASLYNKLHDVVLPV